MLNTSKKKLFKALKNWVPPVIFKFLHNLLGKKTEGLKFHGPYSSWLDAKKSSTGYNAEDILDKVLDATLKVKSGEAVYERDSVLFDEVEYSWPVTAALMWAASKNCGKLNVLDFGGSLGSSYFENKKLLDSLNAVKWSVVEQGNFVEAGKRLIQDQSLSFHKSINESIQFNHPKVILISSVLQYLESPYEQLSNLLKVNADILILDRTIVNATKHDYIHVQKVPSWIYKASYPCRSLSENKLKDEIEQKYDLLSKFKSLDFPGLDKINSTFNGYIYVKN